MKKQPDITAITRENLVEAFWGLYCQKKIDNISIKEITDKAGYHRSTFYEYFVDIYDVLNQMEDSLLADIKERALEAIEVGFSDDVLQLVAELYKSRGKYLSVLLGENGDPNFSKKLKAVMRPALMETFALSESDIHTTYILEFGFSAILSTVTYWYQRNMDISSSDLIILVRSMLMNGVFPMVQKYSALPPKA